MKNAFTMIELTYVIVILGILSAVALPKFTGTKNMAELSSARADVAAIRSSIMTERQSQLIKGNNTTPYIPQLSEKTTTLFTGGTPGRTLLTYGIVAGTGAGQWRVNGAIANNDYFFKADTTDIAFDYNTTNGLFTCDRGTAPLSDAEENCRRIID